MTGPVPNNQDESLDPENLKHQMCLLKSAHCCRQVLYRGLNQFINSLTLYQAGGKVAMTVYLAGITDGIDSAEIPINSAKEEE